MLDTRLPQRVQMVTTRSLPYTFSIADPPPGLPGDAEVLGRASGENFPVASLVLPKPCRRQLMDFYGYARLVDQIGDSYQGDRLAALDWLAAETEAALQDPAGRYPLVAAAARSIRALGASPAPLFDLIEANRRDQVVTSYQTFEDLRDYCRVSADPVGRLVLAAFGMADPARVELSDAVCTGLQLVEHWQDVREDAAAGRVYLPAEDLRRFGVERSELTGTGRPSAAMRALMAFQVARAREWLDRGLPLVAMLPGRYRLAVAGFWAGGRAALEAIAERDFDVTRPPTRPRPDRVAALMVRAVVRSGATGT